MKDFFYKNYTTTKVVVHGFFLVAPIVISIYWLIKDKGELEPLTIILLTLAGAIEVLTPYFDSLYLRHKSRQMRFL